MARRRADACYRELGAELRKRRIAANLTMRELAYHLDWSPSTVSRVESGYIGLPTTEVLPPPRSSRAIRFSGSAANTSGCGDGGRCPSRYPFDGRHGWMAALVPPRLGFRPFNEP